MAGSAQARSGFIRSSRNIYVPPIDGPGSTPLPCVLKGASTSGALFVFTSLAPVLNFCICFLRKYSCSYTYVCLACASLRIFSSFRSILSASPTISSMFVRDRF